MTSAIMQPYVFPYLGYFQLINAVDIFVFYDDVNFIKQGWINRNKLLTKENEIVFTIPVSNISSFKKINETKLAYNQKWLHKFYKTISLNYGKAPHFDEIYNLIQEVFDVSYLLVSDLAIASVEKVIEYLDMRVDFKMSSRDYSDTVKMEKTKRLIEICHLNNSNTYINPIGGVTLYNKEDFKQAGIQLHFIKNSLPAYPQFENNFIPGLSIIDVMMFNSKAEIKTMLNQFTLV